MSLAVIGGRVYQFGGERGEYTPLCLPSNPPPMNLRVPSKALVRNLPFLRRTPQPQIPCGQTCALPKASYDGFNAATSYSQRTQGWPP
jgi:hypothetical protein